MGRDLTHDEIRELLGAHALGATGRDESDAVERHLLECGDCRAELSAHRETSALLDAAYPALAPHVWDRIAAAMVEDPPPLRLDELAGRRAAASGRGTPVTPVAPAAGRARRVPLAVAAAVAVLALVAGGVVAALVADRGTSPSAPPTMAALARQAAAQPGSRRVELASIDRATTVDVVVTAGGTGYVTGGNLPHLPSGETYQLWGIVGQTPVSLGVLGPDPYATRFQVVPGATALALSREQRSGAVTPTLPAVASAGLT